MTHLVRLAPAVSLLMSVTVAISCGGGDKSGSCEYRYDQASSDNSIPKGLVQPHVGDDRRHDLLHLIAIEPANAKRLACLDLARGKSEVVAAFVAEAQLAIHALDDEMQDLSF
jgi:hypothetical protein